MKSKSKAQQKQRRRRTPCPFCGGLFFPQGMGVHKTWCPKNPEASRRNAEVYLGEGKSNGKNGAHQAFMEVHIVGLIPIQGHSLSALQTSLDSVSKAVDSAGKVLKEAQAQDVKLVYKE